MNTGRVKFYNDQKGFGFITGDDGKEYFFHITDLVSAKTVAKDALVSYDTEENKKGISAKKVVVL